MMVTYREKQKNLLEQMDVWCKRDVAVAFSGGVDSSLLLHLAAEATRKHKRRVYAVTFQTELHPNTDLQIAREVASVTGAIHEILYVDEFSNPAIRHNPVDRCYLCKKMLYQSLVDFASDKRINTIIEGTNADDLLAYRPGILAILQLGLKSPLADFGFTKEEVRTWAKECGISVAERPSTPCLATRLPYHTRITKKALRQIEEGERCLKDYGFRNVRLRKYEDLARIEVDPEQFSYVLEKRLEITEAMRKIGFTYVTLDLKGFRSGSMDESID